MSRGLTPLTRAALALACLTSASAAYAVACSSATPDGTAELDGAVATDGASEDSGDAATTPMSGDAQTGEPCVFNRECIAADRCSCDEDSGLCTCQVGPRGTGLNGVTTCDSGDQCQSSLCVEGNGAFYCTDECANAGSCKAKLPICTDISFIGRICVRNPDGG